MSRAPILNILCGVPGAGKSTYAKTLESQGYVVMSSDKIRKVFYGDENCQTHNDSVFDILYKVATDHLSDGRDVVIDATNINVKTRGKALSHFTNVNCIKVCTVICTPPIGIKINDANRKRCVGSEVIDKYLKLFEIPTRDEGFDYIEFYYPQRDKGALEDLEVYISDFALYYEQNNPHHSHTVGEHCVIASNAYLLENETKDKDIANALLYHDIGKPYTMTRDEKGVNHYYGHGNYGAYMCVCSRQFRLGKLSPESVFYINHHMSPYLWQGKQAEKFRKFYGDEVYNNLMIVHKYDDEAH